MQGLPAFRLRCTSGMWSWTRLQARGDETALPTAKEPLTGGLQLSGGKNKGRRRTGLHSAQSMAVRRADSSGQEGCCCCCCCCPAPGRVQQSGQPAPSWVPSPALSEGCDPVLLTGTRSLYCFFQLLHMLTAPSQRSQQGWHLPGGLLPRHDKESETIKKSPL